MNVAKSKEGTMKNKKNWLGLLVMVLVFGMTVVGCGDGDDDKSTNGDAKTITITGIIGKTGRVALGVFSNIDKRYGVVAEAQSNVSNNSANFFLVDEHDNPFTGSGSYILLLNFWSDDSASVYTNSQTLISLGLSKDSNDAEIDNKLPRYNITSATSTIDFGKFANIPDDWWLYDEQ
jgi:hypothetical protein